MDFCINILFRTVPAQPFTEHNTTISSPFYLQPMGGGAQSRKPCSLVAIVNIFYIIFRLKTGLESSIEPQLIVIKPVIAYIFMTYFILEEKVKL